MGEETTHVMDDNHICITCANAFIYFGEYPQKIQAEGVTLDEAQRDARGYYLGSDNAYYAKVTAAPQGISVTHTQTVARWSMEHYYFKVEPILWRILSQSDGTALILCDKYY